MLSSFPPFRWFRQLEDKVFALASEAEYRLKIVPRSTRIVPTTFDRRMVRTFLLVMPVLIGTFFIGDRALRARVLFGMLVAIAVLLALIFVADAFPGKRSAMPPPRVPPKVPPKVPPRPPASRNGPSAPRRP